MKLAIRNQFPLNKFKKITNGLARRGKGNGRRGKREKKLHAIRLTMTTTTTTTKAIKLPWFLNELMKAGGHNRCFVLCYMCWGSTSIVFLDFWRIRNDDVFCKFTTSISKVDITTKSKQTHVSKLGWSLRTSYSLIRKDTSLLILKCRPKAEMFDY